MATNIPPHNLTEVINGCLALIDNPNLELLELMQHIPGPDFPTRGIINGTRGIIEAYHSGRGRIYVRARTEILEHESSGKQQILVHELPYQVNKARLIERIAELVKEKKIEGISELRDESDKDGMRIVIEVKRGESADVLLNNLYAQTQMQTVFGINMVALVDGQPRLLNLKQLLEAFIRHRQEVVTRRTRYELRKARERAHVLEGLAVALANIDEVIDTIKRSANPSEAKEKLLAMSWAPGMVTEMLQKAGADATKLEDSVIEYGLTEQGYKLSPTQAQAILDLRLHRLTGLEQNKILKEFEEILEKIKELQAILADDLKLMAVIRDELTEIREQFGDARKTEIREAEEELTIEDLIPEEDVVVTLSHQGYAKSQPVTTYRSQKRGGRGVAATAVKDEDFIDKLFIASSHDTILCFSSIGKVYWLKVYQLPQSGRTARGKPIVNLLPLEEGERINTVLSVNEFSSGHYVFMATVQGVVKKTPLEDFSRPRASGIRAIEFAENDGLVGAAITDGKRDVMLFASDGKAVRFNEDNVRPMGRTARGVKGIKLADESKVISLIIPSEGCTILNATERGYGKRTLISEYPLHKRGGQGVISIQTSERNGQVVGAVQCHDEDEMMLISSRGTLVRTTVQGVSLMGRNTQGVGLIRLGEGESLVGVQVIAEPEEEEESP
ncbi:MAG TPA: DNA gyrase subunit A, partial [Gammaproteobacteria bacterium]|nr:DNA gyrase subunit A [Gammaproteobacteria bacterium]